MTRASGRELPETLVTTLVGTALGALILGAIGFVIVLSIPPDPRGYVCGASWSCFLVVAIVAILRSPRPTAILPPVLIVQYRVQLVRVASKYDSGQRRSSGMSG